MSGSEEEFLSADEGEHSGSKPETKVKRSKELVPSATGETSSKPADNANSDERNEAVISELSSKVEGNIKETTAKLVGNSEANQSTEPTTGTGKKRNRKKKNKGHQTKPSQITADPQLDTLLEKDNSNHTIENLNKQSSESKTETLKSPPDIQTSSDYTPATTSKNMEEDDGITDDKSDNIELPEDELNPVSHEEVKIEQAPGNADTEGAENPELCATSSVSQDASESLEKEHRNVLDKLSDIGEQKRSQSDTGWGSWGGGWSSWGSNILSTATNSIQTFTGQVSDGMHTVVETFEQSVGAPPAEQLASELSDYVKEPEGEPLQLSDSEASGKESPVEGPSERSDSTTNDDWLFGVTGNLQSTTMGLVSSGLGVLETIGKKTMDHIKEQDPGFKKTKNLMRGQKVNLSQVLREAAAESELSTHDERKIAQLSSLFDHYQGLVHLEAMEMLSITSLNVVTSGESDRAQEVVDSLERVSNKFSEVQLSDDEDDEPNGDHDFESGIKEFVSKICVDINTSRLLSTSQSTKQWQDQCEIEQDNGERKEGLALHRQALSSFAQLTALVIEIFRKSAELLILKADNETVDTPLTTEIYIGFLELTMREISVQTRKYNTCLSTAADDSEDPDSVNELITSVFLESANCKSYMSDAFKLLKPVMQHVHLKRNCT